MKLITAYIRANRLDSVKQGLEDAGIFGLSVESVRGYGRQLGRTDQYRGSTYAVNLLPKMKVEIAVVDEDVEVAIAEITKATHTGEIGDGKIFVSELEDVVRISTGERGEAALK